MADENTGQQPTPTPPPELEERAIREGAFHVIQQGVQLAEDIGLGAGGFATAWHLAKAGKGDGTPSGPPKPQAPSDTEDKP